MKNKTILIVDDTIANLDILVELLDQYDVIDATNGKDALEIASTEKIDLILLDIMMPDMDGYEVCERLKANDKTKYIPVVFITAKTDEHSIYRAYDVGGTDYITKPFLPKELLARVKKELKMQDLIDELKFLSSTDPMTKLYNRRYFTKISQHIFGLATRENQDISIIMLDIDKFKRVNDTYGHRIGDDVIIALANIMINSQRSSDVVCRYGGEEFVILLPNTVIEEARAVAEKLRKIVEATSVKLEHGKELKFTISLGISQVDIKNDINIEKALNQADIALYEAKKSGRNRVC